MRKYQDTVLQCAISMYTSKVGEVVGAAGTEGSARTANKKVYNGKVSLASIIL